MRANEQPYSYSSRPYPILLLSILFLIPIYQVRVDFTPFDKSLLYLSLFILWIISLATRSLLDQSSTLGLCPILGLGLRRLCQEMYCGPITAGNTRTIAI